MSDAPKTPTPKPPTPLNEGDLLKKRANLKAGKPADAPQKPIVPPTQKPNGN